MAQETFQKISRLGLLAVLSSEQGLKELENLAEPEEVEPDFSEDLWFGDKQLGSKADNKDTSMVQQAQTPPFLYKRKIGCKILKSQNCRQS